MKLKKAKEEQITQIYDKWLHAYMNADVSTYDSYLHKNYHFIGSTNNEEFLDKKHTTDFFKLTGEQFAGISDLRNETKIIEQFDEHIFITHFFDAWFLNENNWSYYGRFRFSSVMKIENENHLFIYQHFSMPDSKSDNGQTIGFENEKVSIDIADNFPEIPVNIEDKIVQPFFTTKKGTEGTGLGLSITYAIVKAHSGGLRMQTKEGKGTTFIVELQKNAKA